MTDLYIKRFYHLVPGTAWFISHSYETNDAKAST